MPSFPDATLTTSTGLTLSSLMASDASALMSAFSDAELRRWLPLPSPYTMDLAESWCTSTSRELLESGRGFVLGVRDRDALVASIDAKRVDWRARTLELSYWTAASHRGHGVMSTAVRRVADWVIGELGFERIELRIATENVGSLRTAARAGFVREGVARNAGFTDAGRVDLAVFSLIRSDRPSSG
ncbi:GNAT family N-acetyltransferase [Microbacterium sp.]|uniref:GNAT family N-acetyltransferase n=1 Tax=Microbacterium sp. TaxID=51671 RepID=UPI00281153C4|nr:GNAT family N-acetyltransferase [Microbacterium sp.]